MEIVQQSPSLSHSHVTLLLPAPKIAGLLPARVGVEPEQAATQPVSAFIYDTPQLAELPTEKRECLLDAARTLLDVAVGFVLDDLNEDALRAAQVLFHRQIVGHSPRRPMNPVTYRAERDADILEWALSAAKASRQLAERREARAERERAVQHE